MKGNTILAIDPGTREIGVAVLDAGDLLYYGVKTIKAQGKPPVLRKEAARIVGNLIAEYQPACLALEQLLVVQQSAEFLAIAIRAIKATAEREGLMLYEYAPMSVRRFICHGGKATKQEVARKVAARYPELSRYLHQQSKWQEMYYARMFDAVALGLTCALTNS